MCSIFGYTAKDIPMHILAEEFSKSKERGPDMTRMEETPSGVLGYHRLAIMGLDETGMQPFALGADRLVCNGEIYAFRPLRDALAEKYEFRSGSDCEILLPLWREHGPEMFKMLDAEFALLLYDAERDRLIAARDPIGIRPLYYGYSESGHILFSSEARCLVGLTSRVSPFPPGCWYDGERFVRYRDLTEVEAPVADDLDTVCENIRSLLIQGIVKRLDADAPVGFLLSGGLDSSLVCAVAASVSEKPIRTFAIGMREDAIDLKYARQTAEYLKSDHTEVVVSPEDILAAVEPVIARLGTWDITTVRASIGMYLVCRYIHEHTDIRVLLTGEISDELFGYKYTDFAPSAEAFQQEAEKRLRELHMYDVLRADRCIADNALEARVPFGDLAFVSYVMS
ncbi:MAG TPA: asparagine synthase-related protein, partial [Oscillospiraceae bacterium]|nr:asparagine synthase-related protein [Oscillospiraceae bacterium]